MKRMTPLLLALALGACASSRQASDSVAMTGSAVTEAAAQPLKDLNIVKDEIPPILRQTMKDPYAHPGRIDCGWLEHEVRALDLALGPDIDLPAQEKTLASQGSEAVANAAANAVKDAAGELIPFRSLVRRLTGAEKNAQEMRDALKAGDVRRAYLKGLGLERGCAYPAAPAPGTPSAGPGPGPAEATAAPAATPAEAAPAQATPTASATPGA
jgi:hypothetical protein